MQATLRQTAPRLALLIPDFHNPTGALVGEDDRRGVLRTARTPEPPSSSTSPSSSSVMTAPP